MKMAALEAALDETIKELSQDGRISQDASPRQADQSADASVNDINAQIDRWLKLHENDRIEYSLLDGTLSESESGASHRVPLHFSGCGTDIIPSCCFGLTHPQLEAGGPSGFASPLSRMPSRIANLADTPPDAVKEQRNTTWQLETRLDSQVSPADLGGAATVPQAHSRGYQAAQSQIQENPGAAEIPRPLDIDSQMQSAVAEFIQTGRQASLEIAASVAEMMRTSPRRCASSDASVRSSTSSNGSKTARVIARGPGRLARVVPEQEDARAKVQKGVPDTLQQCVDIVSEEEMLHEQCAAEKAVEKQECSSTHNSIILLSSPSSSVNSSIM